MKFITVFVLSFVSVLFVAIILCALNGMDEIAFLFSCAIVVALWNYRIIRRKYARGL